MIVFERTLENWVRYLCMGNCLRDNVLGIYRKTLPSIDFTLTRCRQKCKYLQKNVDTRYVMFFTEHAGGD